MLWVELGLHPLTHNTNHKNTNFNSINNLAKLDTLILIAMGHVVRRLVTFEPFSSLSEFESLWWINNVNTKLRCKAFFVILDEDVPFGDYGTKDRFPSFKVVNLLKANFSWIACFGSLFLKMFQTFIKFQIQFPVNLAISLIILLVNSNIETDWKISESGEQINARTIKSFNKSWILSSSNVRHW
jgi:hypothetical protein